MITKKLLDLPIMASSYLRLLSGSFEKLNGWFGTWNKAAPIVLVKQAISDVTIMSWPRAGGISSLLSFEVTQIKGEFEYSTLVIINNI